MRYKALVFLVFAFMVECWLAFFLMALTYLNDPNSFTAGRGFILLGLASLGIVYSLHATDFIFKAARGV